VFFAKFAGKDHKNILRAPLFLLFWDFLGTFLDFFCSYFGKFCGKKHINGRKPFKNSNVNITFVLFCPMHLHPFLFSLWGDVEERGGEGGSGVSLYDTPFLFKLFVLFKKLMSEREGAPLLIIVPILFL
jgi:hypothetical protein